MPFDKMACARHVRPLLGEMSTPAQLRAPTVVDLTVL